MTPASLRARLRYAVRRARKGEPTTIDGRTYRGGQFLPGADAKAKPKPDAAKTPAATKPDAGEHLARLASEAGAGRLRGDGLLDAVDGLARGTGKAGLFAAARHAGVESRGLRTKRALVDAIKDHLDGLERTNRTPGPSPAPPPPASVPAAEPTPPPTPTPTPARRDLAEAFAAAFRPALTPGPRAPDPAPAPPDLRDRGHLRRLLGDALGGAPGRPPTPPQHVPPGFPERMPGATGSAEEAVEVGRRMGVPVEVVRDAAASGNPAAHAYYDPVRRAVFVNAFRPEFGPDRAALLRQYRRDRHFGDGDPNHIIHHEVAHALHHRKLGSRAFLAIKQGWSPEQARMAFTHVSRRAAKDPHEFVAEAYAGMAAGKKYPPAVMDLYRKLEGPGL